MNTLDAIMQMMAVGDTAEADVALKELLAKEPGNLQAKMLYGTCRQLLGDDETFKRIHDELAPKMEKLMKEEPKSETVSLWGKYQRLWEYLIVAGLIVAGVGASAWLFGKDILNMFGVSDSAVVGEHAIALYAGPEYYKRTLYGGPPRDELMHTVEKNFIKTSDEDTETIK